MKIDVHVHHHASAEDRERARRLSQSIAAIRETLEMTISPKVQDALDRIRSTQSLVVSVKDGIGVLNTQNATLQATVADLQKKLDAGETIGADDLAGLAEITSDIDQVNAQLQSAIPANTPGVDASGKSSGSGASGAESGSPTGQALDPNGVAASGGNPQTDPSNPGSASGAEPTADEQAQQKADAEASAAAKPLAGTGV